MIFAYLMLRVKDNSCLTKLSYIKVNTFQTLARGKNNMCT